MSVKSNLRRLYIVSSIYCLQEKKLHNVYMSHNITDGHLVQLITMDNVKQTRQNQNGKVMLKFVRSLPY